MNKPMLTTCAVAMLAVAGATYAEGTVSRSTADAGLGTAISGTANAAYHKAAEGVNNVRKEYHESMATTNAEAARENLQQGNFAAAAEDARDAAEHQAEAGEAAADAKTNNRKADTSWSKAKKAVD